MPRNAQGLYSLPAGNPVVPGTVITSTWANSTMPDIAEQLNNVITPDGVIPMTAPLTLAANGTTQPRHAASKEYVDQFVAYTAGLPVGAVVAYASSINPTGFLLCNGQAVLRADYPDLFIAISTTFGAGDGVYTFNVPDLRAQFIRGKDGTRTIGSVQAGSLASHSHAITDPKHNHTVNTTRVVPNVSGTVEAIALTTTGFTATTSSNTTGVTAVPTGGTETVPQNMALDYYIKAIAAQVNSTPIDVIDEYPTAGSANAVSSGGVFAKLAEKQSLLTLAGWQVTVLPNNTVEVSFQNTPIFSADTSGNLLVLGNITPNTTPA